MVDPHFKDEDLDEDFEETPEETDNRRKLLSEIITPELRQKWDLKIQELAASVGSRLVKEVKEARKAHPITEDIEDAGEEVEEDEEPQYILAGSLEETLACLTTHLSKKYHDPIILKTFPHELIFEAEEKCFLAKYRFDESGRPLIEVCEKEPLEVELVFRKKGAVSEKKRDEVDRVRRLAGLPLLPEKPSQPLDESKLTSEERHARVLAGLAVYDSDGNNMLLNE